MPFGFPAPKEFQIIWHSILLTNRTRWKLFQIIYLLLVECTGQLSIYIAIKKTWIWNTLLGQISACRIAFIHKILKILGEFSIIYENGILYVFLFCCHGIYERDILNVKVNYFWNIIIISAKRTNWEMLMQWDESKWSHHPKKKKMTVGKEKSLLLSWFTFKVLNLP